MSIAPYDLDWFYAWLKDNVALLNLVVLFVVVPIYRHVQKIRTNEAAHIQKCLDNIKSSVSRLENKFDEHLHWHLK